MSIAQNRKLGCVTERTLIVGADIAKKRHVARAGNYRGMELAKPLTFDNRRAGLERLLHWIQELKQEYELSEVVFGVEPTGHYWMNLAQFLRQRGITVVLVNPLHVKKSKELDDNSPTKNDTKDAWVITQLVKDGRFFFSNQLADEYAELRIGMNERERLEKDRQRIGGRIQNWLDRYFPEFFDVFREWEGKTARICLQHLPCPADVAKSSPEQIMSLWRLHGIKRGVGIKRAQMLHEAAQESLGLTQGLTMAREELRILLEQYELLEKQIASLWARIVTLLDKIPGVPYMLTIPGVGLTTVTGFLAEVGDFTQYEHWRQIQKLAGYDLKQNNSGQHKGQTRITKRGRPRLRALLYRCVLPLVMHNDQFQALHIHYTTRPENPLKKKQSLVALCGKLIRILFALGTKQVPYDGEKVIRPLKDKELAAA